MWPGWFYRAYLGTLLEVETRMAKADVLVAEEGATLVGSITWYDKAANVGRGWPAGWGGIRALAVAPSARGNGVGRQLAAKCVALGAHQQCLGVGLHTDAAMRAAIKLYTRLGFARAPSFDVSGADFFGYSRRPDDVLAVAYRLDLDVRRSSSVHDSDSG